MSKGAAHPIFFEPSGCSADLRGGHVFLTFSAGEIMLSAHNAELLSGDLHKAFFKHCVASLEGAPSNVVQFPKKAKKRARS